MSTSTKIENIIRRVMRQAGKKLNPKFSDILRAELKGLRDYVLGDSEVMLEVLRELEKAKSLWPAYNSAHEGLGVLLEEVHELQTIVFTNQSKRDLEAMRKEAVQVAAVACRFAEELCNERMGRR